MKAQVWQRCFLFGVLACLVAPGSAHAVARAGRGIVVRTAGIVEYQGLAQSSWLPARVGMAFPEGTAIRCREGGEVDFAFTTKALMKLSGYGLLRLKKISQDTKGLPAGQSGINNTEIMLERGKLFVQVGKQPVGSKFLVHSALGTTEVKGTKFVVWSEGNQVFLRVVEGAVNVISSTGATIAVGANQQLKATRDSATGRVATDSSAAPAPVNDAVSQAFASFEQGMQTLQNVVMNSGAVDVEQLLQIAAGANATTPAVVTVGNPVAEASPSAP